ncbi:alpha-crystallin B chain-like [Bacillus rossius redtenbacheri]|uniref:alpha-crystallin B chain-like n=1 Tax=Bacillus rossius redtenbacheri TaxID=93214 RepID=UPI002FDE319C
MSMLPYVFRDAIDDFYRPMSLFDQNFGMGLLNSELARPRYWERPLRQLARMEQELNKMIPAAGIVDDPNQFKVNVDVQQFRPEEIKVKTVDNCVVVEGKHEERKDEHGYITREFQRRYTLPDGVDPAAVTSTLSSDGVLSIAAPKQEALKGGERVVPIAHTNAPAVKHTAEK